MTSKFKGFNPLSTRAAFRLVVLNALILLNMFFVSILYRRGLPFDRIVNWQRKPVKRRHPGAFLVAAARRRRHSSKIGRLTASRAGPSVTARGVFAVVRPFTRSMKDSAARRLGPEGGHARRRAAVLQRSGHAGIAAQAGPWAGSANSSKPPPLAPGFIRRPCFHPDISGAVHNNFQTVGAWGRAWPRRVAHRTARRVSQDICRRHCALHTG